MLRFITNIPEGRSLSDLEPEEGAPPRKSSNCILRSENNPVLAAPVVKDEDYHRVRDPLSPEMLKRSQNAVKLFTEDIPIFVKIIDDKVKPIGKPVPLRKLIAPSSSAGRHFPSNRLQRCLRSLG